MPALTVKDANGQVQEIELPSDPIEHAQLEALLAALASNGGDQLRVEVTAALPAGSNNVGTVGVTTLPDVTVASLPNVTLGAALPSGSNNIGTVDIGSTPLAGLTGALASNGSDEVRVTQVGGPPTDLHAGQKTVSTSGTPEALVGTSQPLAEGVEVKALASNSGAAYVQPQGAGAGDGFELAAGESVALAVDDLQKVYVDVDTDGEGVSYIGS